tara:strand:+ start:380 stop:634 length:255 start_codon:yes stop_codon:yes gene_type:complete
MITNFKSVNNVKSLFPFLSGWMSLLMFDQGTKVRSATDQNMIVKMTVMALLTLSYVHDVYIAAWVFLSYWIVKLIFLDYIDDKK